jgi:hypothetical protein
MILKAKALSLITFNVLRDKKNPMRKMKLIDSLNGLVVI